MEAIHQHLYNNTELNDRVLWFDGDSTLTEDQIEQLLCSNTKFEGIFVDHISDNIEKYNQLVSSDQQIKIKKHFNPLNTSWNLPESIKSLDVKDYLFRLVETDETNTPCDIKTRIKRILMEYELFEKHGLIDVLRALIFIINTLNTHNVVWGVGRGSSVSSYILYLIGVHDVDSVLYDLDIHDFIR